MPSRLRHRVEVSRNKFAGDREKSRVPLPFCLVGLPDSLVQAGRLRYSWMSSFASNAHQRGDWDDTWLNHWAAELSLVPDVPADSSGGCNSLLESLSWRFVVQCLSRTLVQSSRHGVEFGLRIH
jgi:hypothetical protein